MNQEERTHVESISDPVAILLAVASQSLAVGGDSKGGANPAQVASVRVVLPADAAPVLKNIAALFARQVEQRCAAKVAMTGEAPLQVELVVQPGIGSGRLHDCRRSARSDPHCRK